MRSSTQRATESDVSAHYQEALQRATQAHGEGRLDEAAALYRSLLDEPGAQRHILHYVLGMAASEQGDPITALAHYDSAQAAGYASADLFSRRAGILHAMGRWDDALDAYDRAVAAGVQTPNLFNNRGVVRETLGAFDDALEDYDAALALNTEYLQARHNKGSTLLKLKRFEDAIECFHHALRLDPASSATWNLFGMALEGLARHAEALQCFDQAVLHRPAYAEAHNNRSIALRWLGRFEEAVESAGVALGLDPALVEAYNSRATALWKLNRFDAALADCDTALAIRPGYVGALINRGMTLEALGRLEGAQADFAAALALEPNKPSPTFNSALAYLRAGDYQRGLPLYEARWLCDRGPSMPLPQETLWLGEQDVAGRTVLLHAEQGLGDMIQFCRFAQHVAARGARVILQVPATLKPLAMALSGPAAVYAHRQPLPPFDLHCPLMSLPLALGLTLDEIAGAAPYLAPSPVAVGIWRKRVPSAEGLPRVGLAWSGNPGHENDHNRSMPLKALAPLFNAKAQFISLQKDYRSDEAAYLDAKTPILRFDQQIRDMSDTAALIEDCDVVISVDTSVAHLAGAMGKPVWLALPRFSDWRWMETRQDTPWYPTARLFRQSDYGDWSGPVDRMAEALGAL